MRELVIVGSPILLPPNPTPPHHLKQHKHSSLKRTKKNSATESSSLRPPLLSDVRRDLIPHRRTRLKYYADLASKLAENGRLDDFLMIAESVLGFGGVDPSQFAASVNVELVSVGVSRVLRDGRMIEALEILSKVEKLGLCPSFLLDGRVRDLLALECRRLVDCGRVEESVGLMEILAGYQFPVKDFVEPFVILKTCVKKRDPNMAIRYACILPHAHILFSSIIHEFGKKQDLASALVVFEASKRKLDGPNMYIFRSIFDACGLCGDPLRSRHIYKELLAQKITPNTYVFNSLMNVNAHDLSYTLHVHKHMQNLGVTVDMTSYNILLKACCLSGRVDLAQDIYQEIKHVASTGFLKLDVITYSTIIKVFADAKMWKMALQIKEDMLAAVVTPNVITWSSLISACANAGLVEQAIQVFEEMLQGGCEPNTQCCNILLYACVESCQYDRAFRLFHSWKKSGFLKSYYDRECSKNSDVSICARNSIENNITHISSCTSDPHNLSFAKVVPFKPSVATYNILMKACGRDYYHAKALMDEMKIAGLSPNQISWSILIDICGSSNNVRGALQAFRKMRDAGIDPDVVAYTTAIKACVVNKNLKIAFLLFEEMKRHRLRPNLVTYNTLLRARRRYGSLHEVQQSLSIYQDMRKTGYCSNDYFLKELIEEWCEGVIQDSDQNHGLLGLRNSGGKFDAYKSQSLLLEKVAGHLQKDISEDLSIDLRGLTKVEARIVVLAVLRMIKESYTIGHPIKDDMVIISGVEEGLGTSHESAVQDAVIKVLRDELGLNVLVETGTAHSRNGPQNPLDSDVTKEIIGKDEFLKEFVSTARRPQELGRLKVTRKSLYHWLQKRMGFKSQGRRSIIGYRG